MHNEVSVGSAVSCLPFCFDFALLLEVAEYALSVADTDACHVGDAGNGWPGADVVAFVVCQDDEN
jgi:hypothetical protein